MPVVTDLQNYFAACDLAIVQGGGMTTIELTALRIPFLYFPIEGQFAQELYVTERLKRHRAGVRMSFSGTTPEALTLACLKAVKGKVNYARVPADGAFKAADIIRKLLN